MTTDELSKDGKRLVRRLVNTQRPVVFLLGSALTAPEVDTGPGVANVRAIATKLREKLGEDAGPAFQRAFSRGNEDGDFGEAYRIGFQVLIDEYDQDEANIIVREAVLGAYDPLSEAEKARVLARDASHRKACNELLSDARIGGWKLRGSVLALGQILASHREKFPRVLTSKFDPLIEVSVKHSGAPARRTMLERDGNPGRNDGDGVHVVYVHGYWFGTDTLHVPGQLEQDRPQLRSTLKEWVRDAKVVVLGYSGWKDVLTTVLAECAADENVQPDIDWAFYEQKAPRVMEMLAPAVAVKRAQAFEHVDMHLFFPALRDALASAEPQPLDTGTSDDELDTDETFSESLAAATKRSVGAMPSLPASLRLHLRGSSVLAGDGFVEPLVEAADGSRQPLFAALERPQPDQHPASVVVFGGMGHGKTAAARAIALRCCELGNPCIHLSLRAAGDYRGELLSEVEKLFEGYGLVAPGSISALLTKRAFLVVIDGTDELESAAAEDRLVAELSALSQTLKLCSFIVTTRTAEVAAKLVNAGFKGYSLAPFDDIRLVELAKALTGPSSRMGEELVRAATTLPFLRRPLFGTLFVALARSGIHPENSKSNFVRSAIELMLSEWPGARETKFDDMSQRSQMQILGESAFEGVVGVSSGRVSGRPSRGRFVELASMLLAREDSERPRSECAATADAWFTWLVECAQLLALNTNGVAHFPHRVFDDYFRAYGLSEKADGLSDEDWDELLRQETIPNRTLLTDAVGIASNRTRELIVKRVATRACAADNPAPGHIGSALALLIGGGGVDIPDETLDPLLQAAISETSKTIGTWRQRISAPLSNLVASDTPAGLSIRRRYSEVLGAEPISEHVERACRWLTAIQADIVGETVRTDDGAGKVVAEGTWPFARWLVTRESPDTRRQACSVSYNRVATALLASAMQGDESANLALVWSAIARSSWLGNELSKRTAGAPSGKASHFFELRFANGECQTLAASPAYRVDCPIVHSAAMPAGWIREDTNWHSTFNTQWLDGQYQDFAAERGASLASLHIANSYRSYSAWTGIRVPQTAHLVAERSAAVQTADAAAIVSKIDELLSSLTRGAPSGRFDVIGFGGALPVNSDPVLGCRFGNTPPGNMDWEWGNVAGSPDKLCHDEHLAEVQRRVELRLGAEYLLASPCPGRSRSLVGQLRLENRWLQSNVEFLSRCLGGSGCEPAVRYRTVLCLGLLAYQTTWAWPWGLEWERATRFESTDKALLSLQRMVRGLVAARSRVRSTRRRPRPKIAIPLDWSCFKLPGEEDHATFAVGARCIPNALRKETLGP